MSCGEQFREINRSAEYCMASYQMTGEKAVHLIDCNSAESRQHILRTSAFVYRGGTFQHPVLKLLYCQKTISYFTEYARLLHELLKMYKTSVIDFWANMEVYSADESLDTESSDDGDSDADDAASLVLSFTDSTGDYSVSSDDDSDSSAGENDYSSDGDSDGVTRKRARHDDDSE